MLSKSREERISWRYDRARALGIEILKLLLNTTIVIAGIPIVFYPRLVEAFSTTAMYWVRFSWSMMLLALVLGLTTFLFIFEGDYHAAHAESESTYGTAKSAESMESRSNLLFDIGHILGVCTGIAFAAGMAFIVVAIWMS